MRSALSPRRLRLQTRLLVLGFFSLPLAAHAEITWRGDFETGDTSQWSYLLNEAGISVVTDPRLEGAHAGRITIDSSHIWPNGLNRVEFQYSPLGVQTAEGADSYFGWSFYLPQLLTSDSHQIGYYESNNTYQQVMSVGVQGSTLTFATRRPQNQEQLRAEDAIEAGRWHDIILHVHWSQNASDGRVSLWLDGQQRVTNAAAQTLADSNPHFIQLGILRDTIETTETLFIDNARAGSTLQDVLALVPDGNTGSGGSSGDNGDDGDDAGQSGSGGGARDDDGDDAGQSGSGGGSNAVGGSGADEGSGTPPPEPASQKSGGCSTAGVGTGPVSPAFLLAFLFGVLGFKRRMMP